MEKYGTTHPMHDPVVQKRAIDARDLATLNAPPFDPDEPLPQRMIDKLNEIFGI
jgi:hypothetical protein